MSRPPGDCSQDYNISVFFSQLSFFKMFPAKRHVAFIGAQHDLCALSDDLAIRKPGVALGPSSTPADRRYFLDHTSRTSLQISSVHVLYQAPGALEYMILKICF